MTRLGILNFGLRNIARPFLARTKAPQTAEGDLRRAAHLFLKPFGTRLEPVAGSAVPISRITCGAVDDSAAILFFHGGGYVAGSPWTHRGMLARLSKLAGLPVFAPDYRLAQTAPFPAAFDDACASWDQLRDTLPAGRIVLGGDSAGGGLAFALLANLLQAGERPAGLMAFSPWTDLTLTGASLDENERTDAILPRIRMPDLCEIILSGADPANPKVSPLLADWSDPPPVYVQASETEILRDDARRMVARLKEAGGEATLDLWPDCPHVWQIFDGWIPEAREALTEAAAFANHCLSLPPRPQSEN